MGATRANAAASVPAGFTITGAGFGHGVGMSQYGAQGMGLDGFTASQILTYYFPGTTVDPHAFATNAIRVGILQDRNMTVDGVAAYKTAHCLLTDSQVAEIQTADAVLLASGSAVRSLVQTGWTRSKRKSYCHR